MKMLNQLINLIGQFGTVSMTDLRQTPGDLISQVELGKVFLITKSGKPVAVISPLPGRTLTIQVDSEGNKGYSL